MTEMPPRRGTSDTESALTARARLFAFTRIVEALCPMRGSMVGGIHAVQSEPTSESQTGSAPVVLLHGASGNALDWTASLFGPVSQLAPVIALDRPGFGYSTPVAQAWRFGSQITALRAAVLALGHRRYRLVGHSYSGPLALAWALAHPDEVLGVLSLSGATMDWGGSGVGLHYRLGGRPVIGDLLAWLAPVLTGPQTLAQATSEVFAPDPMPEGYDVQGGVWLALRPHTFRTNAEMMLRLYPQVRDQVAAYRRLSCPVAIVHGAADTIVPPSIHAAPLADALPGAPTALTLIDGVGHMPHHAAPQAVLAAIEAWLSMTG